MPLCRERAMTLFGLLEEHIRHGILNVHLPDGTHRRFGLGKPEATIHFRDPAALRRIAYDPGFEFGQTYMEGGWDPGDEGLRALLDVTMSQAVGFVRKVHVRFRPNP